MVRFFRISCFPTRSSSFRAILGKNILLRSRFASEFLYGTGFESVRAVQEYIEFDVASAAFGSFSVWHIEFLYAHFKDSVVFERVVLILWFCRLLFV